MPNIVCAAHVDDVRRAEERRHQRVGDLILDERGRAPHPLGEHDHLRVREVGDGVDPAAKDGPRRACER
jgi:hypothetical protein